MTRLSLDFETYYDREYSLSKMTTQEYILDPRFQVLLCGMRWGDHPVQVVEAENLPQIFADIGRTVGWSNVILTCHNTMFDAAILAWRYGIRCGMYTCTMSMAQSLGIPLLTGSASLAAVTNFMRKGGYDLPEKGDEVVKALGKRREHFTPSQWEAYKSYCATDVALTAELFKLMLQVVPAEELRFQDMILRCYTEPVLRIHKPTVQYERERVRQLKEQKLDEVCTQWGWTRDQLATALKSNDKFGAVLRQLGGVTQADMDEGKRGAFLIPTKISAKTGKVAWAFGKTDEGFVELCEHPDPTIQAVCQARLSAKSSIDETRADRFLSLADFGFLAVPYRIGGAHTGRLGGCLVGNTPVLVKRPDGRVVEVPLTRVAMADRVWDGEAWVYHGGVVDRGIQPVITYDGLTGTPDHPVFIEGRRVTLKQAADLNAKLDRSHHD